MSVKVNMRAVTSKAKKTVSSKEFKQEQDAYVRDALLGKVSISLENGTIHTAEEAADKFVSVLKNSINTSGLSANAIAAISDIEYGEPVFVGDKCVIAVWFSGDTSRPSLAPGAYPGGINRLEELLDKGVDHRMRAVHGEWHGKDIWSRTTIPGAHFIDAAKIDFMANYGSEYNVTDITIEYEG